jgi:hypothetical protein
MCGYAAEYVHSFCVLYCVEEACRHVDKPHNSKCVFKDTIIRGYSMHTWLKRQAKYRKNFLYIFVVPCIINLFYQITNVMQL